MDKLRTLTFFLATCEQGSFAAAAKTCNTDPSTVSKAISRLEQQLQLTLFQRSTRQLKVTPSGSRYAQTVRKMFQDLSGCEQELQQQNDTPSGILKISSAVCYGHLYVRPLLAQFCKRYPDIRLELQLNDLHVDIIEADIDIALRTGFVKDSRLVARRLSPMDFLICTSPEFLQTHGILNTPEEYKNAGWIGFRIKQTQQLQPIFLPDENGEYQQWEFPRTHICDDGEAMLNMCIDGLGFAQLPHFLAHEALKTGQLRSIYPYFRPPQPDTGVFAIYPKREFLPARVRVFIEFLKESLQNRGEGHNYTWAQNWPSEKEF